MSVTHNRFVRVLIPQVDKFLVMKSEYKRKEIWNFPGGKCETKDPDLMITAKREVFEECGILVDDLYFFCTACVAVDCVEWQGTYFIARSFKGVPSIQEPKKCKALAFKTKSEIFTLPALKGALHEPLTLL